MLLSIFSPSTCLVALLPRLQPLPSGSMASNPCSIGELTAELLGIQLSAEMLEVPVPISESRVSHAQKISVRHLGRGTGAVYA